MATFESNPWRECYLNGEGIFETRFLLYSSVYVVLNVIGNTCQRSYYAAVEANPGSPPDHQSMKALIASRPTVIAATFHSFATSVIAVGILVLYYTQGGVSWVYQETDLIKIWQTVGLPISLSYFVVDCFFYCLPKKDVIIFVHHFVMCFCHYPVSHSSSAFLAGAGDIEWVTWLSIIGYTAEVATILMNYRWYLINTLEKNWIGFGIVNALVVASWLERVLMFTYLLVAEIIPRAHLYIAQKQILAYRIMVLGHAGIGLLSLYWCVIMCRGGLKSLFVFKKKDPKPLNPTQGFSFADEVTGKNNETSPRRPKSNGTMSPPLSPARRVDDDARAYKNPPLSPSKRLESEARAFKEGTIFSDDAILKGKKLK
mmetsp:Transcript_63061/g.186286  ORF Transcript_63061/g.186286 Transcript_63061/m.186286 type:complete len:371 (-) Transcript_63061:308-1420(-)|eukprot:CAMPEP_0113525546 /NCGR_PEP_ID=MMETSP0015_2-20120614/225_1 /TAXON_ID=2838 /ORGANISM="Odontella" /LENGTH=370 /DNA_ID=CAMNT_0000423731 /DNA_START=172 /DNA_END=1284 /DNA_ORIENTATION=+ /assembly_acc=CAM_ASM_000160